MPVIGFDHVALPAKDPEALLAFYKKLSFGTIHEDCDITNQAGRFSLA